MLFSDAAWLKKCGNSKITNGNNEEINKDSTDSNKSLVIVLTMMKR